MRANRARLALALGLWLLGLAPAGAWWSEDWAFRKSLTLDTTPAGAGIGGELVDFPLLVRLHSGNFGYFLDLAEAAGDLRLVAGDDKTPLKFHLERFDAINQMAFLWVQVPRVPASANTERIWMYYGNPSARPAEDAGGTYDVHHALVLHFHEADGVPRDQTAFANHPSRSGARPIPASFIGGGARFDGTGWIQVPGSPSLALDPKTGWTFSAWVRIDGPQEDSRLVHLGGPRGALELGIAGTQPYARLQVADGVQLETERGFELTPGTWHHLALAVGAGELTLFLDGQARSSVPLDVPGLAGDLLLGAGPEGAGPFTGEVDELQVSRVRRDPAWLLAAARLQGGDGFLVAGEDEQRQGGQGGESYFVSILRNVTLDGWVVIGIIAVIGVVSWMVMGAKALVFARTERDNARFLEQFRALDPSNPAALDRAGGAEDRDLDESPFLTALTGRHEHFQSSSLYRLYHVGAQALQSRLGTSAGARAAALGPQALGAIRAAVEGAMVGETQRLSSQMVLLTIAISGGPFLGLLGTVVGVMITFAAIAATGDVNINAIAPGIAAALVATVAGLAVAIPALFAYNYLSTRLRDLVAQMEVFVGEFVSLAAEQHGQ